MEPANETNSDAFDPVAAFLRRPSDQLTGNGLNQLLPTSAQAESESVQSLEKLGREYAWVSVLNLTSTLLSATEGGTTKHKQSPFKSSSVTTGDSETELSKDVSLKQEDENQGRDEQIEDVDKQKQTKSQEEGDIVLLPHERLMCSMYRALALLQTRQLDKASTVMKELGDLTDSNKEYRYETYGKDYQPNRTGSFIPFELKLLSIEIRVRQDDNGAIEDAYHLKKSIDKDKDRKHLETILCALSSYHLRSGQFNAAIDCAYEVCDICDSEDSWYMCGKVLLRCGDFDACERAFTKAFERSIIHDKDRNSKYLAYTAMLLASRQNFEEAIIEYTRASQILGECTESENHEDNDGYLPVMIANNLSVCLLHVGRVAEAISTLEDILRTNTQLALDEGLVFNLVTLYDLVYPDSSHHKRQTIMKIAQQYSRQGFQLDQAI